MFFDDYGRPKKPTPKLFSDMVQGVICAVLAVVCAVVYKNSWALSIIFALLAVFRFWHHFKTEKNEAKLNAIIDEYGDDDDDVLADETPAEKLSRRERKARYKEFLNDIEDEFADFDIED